MQQTNWKHIWEIVHKYILNKYLIVLIVFGVIFTFVGDQSFIKGLKRTRQIRQTEQLIQQKEQNIQRAQHMIHNLQQRDSLEKIAREQYLMHKDNEDVFLVEEDHD